MVKESVRWRAVGPMVRIHPSHGWGRGSIPRRRMCSCGFMPEVHDQCCNKGRSIRSRLVWKEGRFEVVLILWTPFVTCYFFPFALLLMKAVWASGAIQHAEDSYRPHMHMDVIPRTHVTQCIAGAQNDRTCEDCFEVIRTTCSSAWRWVYGCMGVWVYGRDLTP